MIRAEWVVKPYDMEKGKLIEFFILHSCTLELSQSCLKSFVSVLPECACLSNAIDSANKDFCSKCCRQQIVFCAEILVNYYGS